MLVLRAASRPAMREHDLRQPSGPSQWPRNCTSTRCEAPAMAEQSPRPARSANRGRLGSDLLRTPRGASLHLGWRALLQDARRVILATYEHAEARARTAAEGYQ